MGIAKDFRYTTAEDTLKPNYLRNKFAAIRKAQKEAAAKRKAESDAVSIEQEIKVRVLRS